MSTIAQPVDSVTLGVSHIVTYLNAFAEDPIFA
jgi:hypothetical protein